MLFQILALSSAGLGNAPPEGYISRILDNYFAAENMYKIEIYHKNDHKMWLLDSFQNNKA